MASTWKNGSPRFRPRFRLLRSSSVSLTNKHVRQCHHDADIGLSLIAEFCGLQVTACSYSCRTSHLSRFSPFARRLTHRCSCGCQSLAAAKVLQPQNSVSRQRGQEEEQDFQPITMCTDHHSAMLEAFPCIKHCGRKKRLRKTQKSVTQSRTRWSRRRHNLPFLGDLTEGREPSQLVIYCFRHINWATVS